MARTYRQRNVGLLRQAAQHEVTVGRQVVETRLGIQTLAQHRRYVLRQKRLRPRQRRRIGLEAARLRRHPLAADVLGHLRPRLAKDRKAIIRWFIHPDPHRKAVGHEVGRVGRAIIGHLLLGNRQVQPSAEVGQDVVRPRPGGHDQMPAAVRHVARHQFDLVTHWPRGRHRRVVTNHRAIRPRQSTMGGIAQIGRGDATLGLIDAGHVVGQPELRPAVHNFRCR